METSEEHPELMPVPPPLKPSLVGWKLDKHGLVLAGDGVLETFLVGWKPYPAPWTRRCWRRLEPFLGGGLEQQFVEETIVYNDSWAEKRGTVSPPKSEKRTYFVCRSDGTAAESRPVSIESFSRGASAVTRKHINSEDC